MWWVGFGCVLWNGEWWLVVCSCVNGGAFFCVLGFIWELGLYSGVECGAWLYILGWSVELRH